MQRWEVNYRLPVRRASSDAKSVFAFSDEIDAWLERAKPREHPQVRPVFLVVDVFTPNALSDLKLAIEMAKFNVVTAFTASEAMATAQKFDLDGFVIDSVLLDEHPAELIRELRRLQPSKPCILVGDEDIDGVDAKFQSGNVAAIIEWLVGKFGNPQLEDVAPSAAS